MQNCRNVFHVVFMAFVLLASIGVVQAQVDTKIGTGTTANSDWEYPTPFADAQHSTRSQFLYLASEMKAAGMSAGIINAIRFNVLSLGDYYDPSLSALDNMYIRVTGSGVASLSTTGWEAVNNTVYSSLSYMPVAGINSFTLTTPFFWNGSDNIIIEICIDQSETQLTSANRLVEWTTGLSFNGSRSYAENYNGPVCNVIDGSDAGTQTSRPNIIFNWTAAAPCSAASLAGGTAVTNIARLCAGEEFKLSINNSSVATGLSYQWQSSPDHASWTNIANATTSIQPLTQTASTYYRAVVTCANGGTANSDYVQVLTPASTSGTYTINNKIAASATNFTSFHDAYSFIRCGINGPVVFNVDAGSDAYNEQLILKTIPGMSATNTVTFNGNGAEITYQPSRNTERAVIKLDGADFFTFNNLKITASDISYSYGVQFLNDADYNTIHGCTITVGANSSSTSQIGISVSASATSPTGEGDAFCDNNSFTNNTITGGVYGITLVGSSNNANGNNKISGNTISEFYAAGIYVAYSFRTTIDSNTISRNTRTDGSDYSGVMGISINYLNTKMQVSRNVISHFFNGTNTSTPFYGMNLNAANGLGSLENVFTNNVIYTPYGGGSMYGIYCNNSQNNFFYHNTISLDGDGSLVASDKETIGFYQTGSSGFKINNNNISVSRTSSGTRACIAYIEGSANTADRNNYHIVRGTGVRGVGLYGTAIQMFVADWAAVTGQDAHSLSADPQFANLATGNVQPTNPFIDNQGSSVGVTNDITGAVRSTTTPDMGAYEFQTTACSGATAGTPDPSTNGICTETKLYIDLDGVSSGLGTTYQWQYATSAAGPYTNLGTASSVPTLDLSTTTTYYYQALVACGGSTATSSPVLINVSPAFPAGTYTINKALPTGNGNFASFNDAYTAMSCGITGPIVFNVVAGSGRYDEQLLLGQVKGASATNTITFNGNGDTLHYSAANSDQRAVIKLSHASHFIFDSLVINAIGSGSYGFGVQLVNNSDSNTIRRCTILIDSTNTTADAYAGIVISAQDADPVAEGTIDAWDKGGACDDNLIEGNRIRGGYYGITVVGLPYYDPIYRNRIINNSVTNFYSRGIYVDANISSVVEGNIISRPNRTSVSAFYGISILNTILNLSVTRNIITNPFGGNKASTAAFYGMWFEGPSPQETDGIAATVTNNLLYNINGEGSEYGLYFSTGNQVFMYHNTIALDNKASASASTAVGVYASNTGNVFFNNNLVYITRGGAGTKYGISINSTEAQLRADRNNLYINSEGGYNYIGYFTSARATLAEWRLATHNDTTSTTLDPVFADAANGNYTPTIAPLDNTGKALGVTNDLLNASRSTTTPDIGAYEFSIPGCAASLEAGAATATPNTGICMGTKVAFALSGYVENGNQTYQWQQSVSATGPWVNISEPAYQPAFITEVLRGDYFRCLVKCGTATDSSDAVKINLNAAFPGGVYTISNSGTADFASFRAAVAAMSCGITGAVTFNVAPGTYNEKVYFKKIAGAAAGARVTFQSASGDSASVKLLSAGTVDSNYVVLFDTASYISFKSISVTNTHASNSRVIEFRGVASFDSLSYCSLTGASAAVTSDASSVVYGYNYTGRNLVINSNLVTNGSRGISITSTSALHAADIRIAGNTLNGFFQHGIFSSYCDSILVYGNTSTLTVPATPSGTTSFYAIYTGNGVGYEVVANKVEIKNTVGGNAYGIYLTANTGTAGLPGKLEGNLVKAITGINSAILYGIYATTSTYNRIVNNVVSMESPGASSYGLYINNSGNAACYNNTVNSASSSATNNFAAYINNASSLYRIDMRNNIFSHTGGGKALRIASASYTFSDYNMLYTTGSNLAQLGAATYATLDAWRAATATDLNSIVYAPAFVNQNELRPDLNAPGVWAMHGRGVQISGNDRDFSNNTRPVTLQEGVPDLGAYEFLPASVPPAAVAAPVLPAANTQQVFTLGTDVVSVINWGVTVPSGAVTVKRYSGIAPDGLASGTDYMYFYVDADVPAGTYQYAIQQPYLASWRGYIDNESRIRLGKTDNANVWTVDAASTVNIDTNFIYQNNLTHLDKITGLTNATVKDVDSIRTDSSNKGTRFWAAYSKGNSMDSMYIIIGGADKDADVVVKVNGTSWIRNYHIAAHSFINTGAMPDAGSNSAMIMAEGWSDRGISIESNEPVAAHAFQSGILNMGSFMLMPVGAYGNEYYPQIYRQSSIEAIDDAYTWISVVADKDNTVLEITPSAPTVGARKPGQPFIITLNRGEVYTLRGARISSIDLYDLSGTRIRSLTNNEGKCNPAAVFSGSVSGYVNTCNPDDYYTGGASDFMWQQNTPVHVWGTRYLTAPLPSNDDITVPLIAAYRIAVKDALTVVKVNGAVLTNLQNGYYQYTSTTADYIEAGQPVMVTQYLASGNYICGISYSTPEMTVLVPLGNGIYKADFERVKSGTFVSQNYLNVVIPTAGISSLQIDGSNTFDHSYAHPNLPGYSVVIKKWPAGDALGSIQSDSAFTAILYGVSYSANSYAYTVGAGINNLRSKPGITNMYDSSGTYSQYTCVGTPFHISMKLDVQPDVITWKLSAVSNLSPAQDITQNSPVPDSVIVENGRTYYVYNLLAIYSFSATGVYKVPVTVQHSSIGSCDHTASLVLPVTVKGKPTVTFTVDFDGCQSDTAYFHPATGNENNSPDKYWKWSVTDTNLTDKEPAYHFVNNTITADTTYKVSLLAITADGCVADATKDVVVKPEVPIVLASDSIATCTSSAVTFTVTNAVTGVTYNWYTQQTAGTPVYSGSSYQFTAPAATTYLYMEAVNTNGCVTAPRKVLVADVFALLTKPLVVVDSAGVSTVRFAWQQVTDATGYEVSTDGGVTWITPSSGATGLTHTVNGLTPGQEVTLLVKALGVPECRNAISTAVTGAAAMDQVFAATGFTPNGDGLNDVFIVRGGVIRSIHLAIFNQWGEKIFETSNKDEGWKGDYKGQMQPSGVYMYVANIVLIDGSSITKKGSVNLVR